MGWKKDVNEEILELRQQIGQLRIELAQATALGQENDREINELRTRLWPWFVLGQSGIQEFIYDTEEAE
jgi:GAF domain-containing protein